MLYKWSYEHQLNFYVSHVKQSTLHAQMTVYYAYKITSILVWGSCECKVGYVVVWGHPKAAATSKLRWLGGAVGTGRRVQKDCLRRWDTRRNWPAAARPCLVMRGGVGGKVGRSHGDCVRWKVMQEHARSMIDFAVGWCVEHHKAAASRNVK